MQSTPFNLLDELYLHLEREDEPFCMHQELRAEGRIDPERLQTAIMRALELHPMARAFQLPWKGSDREYHWGIADGMAANPLTVVDCKDETEVADARAALLNTPVPLTASPPFRCLLAHHPNGDYFIMSISHTVTDGTGQARFMRSIVRAYADQSDPVPGFDIFKYRDLGALFGAPTLQERLRRYVPLAQYLAESLQAPGRVATESGLEEDGFGCHFQRLRGDDLKRIRDRREGEASVNDVLLAALHLTVQEWNQLHGHHTDRLTAMMPINMRPPHWHAEIVGNYSVFVAVGSHAKERHRFSDTLAATTRWTRWYKETKGTAQLIDLLRGAQWLPLWLKRVSRDLIPLTGNRVVDSTALTNLGRMEDLGTLGGKAGRITEFCFSPPARMPLGVSLGVVTHGDTMALTFRYRRTQFSPGAAARFAVLFRKILLAESGD